MHAMKIIVKSNGTVGQVSLLEFVNIGFTSGVGSSKMSFKILFSRIYYTE
jgi:hypothetical protein